MTNGLKDMLLIYQDICNEIEYYEILLKQTEMEYQINQNMLVKHQRKKNVPITSTVDNIDSIIERYKKIEGLLNIKKRIKKSAEEQLSKFEGLEHRVAYMRFVEGKTLYEISLDTKYSEAHIKRISAKISCYLDDTELLNIK